MIVDTRLQPQGVPYYSQMEVKTAHQLKTTLAKLFITAPTQCGEIAVRESVIRDYRFLAADRLARPITAIWSGEAIPEICA